VDIVIVTRSKIIVTVREAIQINQQKVVRLPFNVLELLKLAVDAKE